MNRHLKRMIAATSEVEPARLILELLSILRAQSGAAKALVVRQGQDSSTAVWADPPDARPADEPFRSLFEEAIAADELRTTGEFAILPIPAGPAFKGAAVLIWTKAVIFDDELRGFLETAMLFLRTAVPLAACLVQRQSERDRVTAILDTFPQGVVFLEVSGAQAWANREAMRLLKLGSQPVSAGAIATAVRRMREGARPAENNPDELIWTSYVPELSLLSIANRSSCLSGVEGQLWLFTDITEQRIAAYELRESEDRYKELFDNSPLPAWVYDTETLAILTVNCAAVAQYGYTRAEFLAMTVLDLRPASETAKLLLNLKDVQRSHQRSGPWTHQRKDGSLRMVEVSSHEVRFSGRRARLVMVNDVTERNLVEQRLRDQEDRWQLALRGSNDGLWDYDIIRQEVFYSRRWKEMLGFEEHELPNLPQEWEKLVHPEDLPATKAKLKDHLSRRALFYIAEYRMRCQDGSYKWVLSRGQAVWNENGEAVRMVGSHADITERKQSEAQLTRHALYDSLTGLLNRRYLLEELDRSVQRAEDQNQPLSLALGDLDRFKFVNDNHGHAAGDEVLAVFGQIMQQGQRQGDVVGRIGGDEFCMIFPRSTLSEASVSVERTQSRLCTMAFGVAGGVPFTVSATFGVAAWAPGMSAKQLLEKADKALYRAKERCHMTVSN